MRLSPETILWAVLSIGITCELTAAARGSSRRPKCRKDEFECVNKQRCIHEFDVCDGKKDCPDGSDETASQCQEFGLSCGSQPFSFKCAYGACIDKSKECDNVEYDCADNSDEAQCHKSSDTPEVTSRCQSSEFTCQSGDCVDLNDVCDGISNCKDQSDETIKQCAQMTCQPFSFQCAYGACIDWIMRCDGKKDCADGSDEADELCNKPVDTPDVNKADELNSTTDTCPFPDHPNTIYEYVCQGDGCKSLSPGTPLKKLQAVRASCPPGYAFPNKFIKKNAMICLAPPKFHATITCEKMCPPLVSEFHELECIFNGKNVPCHSPMYPGTFARLECKEFYRPLSDVVVVTQTQCQDGGTWTYSLYKCIPECGRKVRVDHNKVAYGTTVSPGESPWYAGFWTLDNGTYTHFCGGTIISPKLIITAAHCLAGYQESLSANDDSENKSIENIRVAVGKFNSKWDVQGPHEQRFRAKKINKRRGYVGAPSYEKDLAVVELMQNIQLNEYVSPACIDWKTEGVFTDLTQGYIVGFGKNENHTPSETLQAASLFFISKEECDSRIFKSTGGKQQGIMWDQFCAGVDYPNNNDKITSVQRGDSGGGYTFERNRKYYLYGVLSHHFTATNEYAVYTSIPEHVNWLIRNNFAQGLF